MHIRRSVSIPNTFGPFQHLDVYDKPMETTVATPVYMSSPMSTEMGCDGDVVPDVWEMWPPEPAVFRSSVLAAHCGWMASQTPSHAVCEYARAHWMTKHCFPAFGHVHLLYACTHHSLHPWTTAHEQAPSDVQEELCVEGLVYLPAELCICDCAMTRAPVDQQLVAGPLQLLSRWLAESGTWRILPRKDLPEHPPVHPGDTGDWHNFLVELYCVAWPLHALDELGAAVRNPETHGVWVPPVIDAVGSNRNIDATILQCSASLLLFTPPPGIIRDIWAVYRDPSQQRGGVAAWLTPEPPTSVRWAVSNALPAIWSGAIAIFNSWTDAASPPVQIHVQQQESTPLAVVLHRMRPSANEGHNNDDFFVWSC
jgi:hypothetical protein